MTKNNVTVVIKENIRSYGCCSDEFKLLKEFFYDDNSKDILDISEKEFIHIINKNKRKSIKHNLIKDMKINKKLLEKLNDSTN
jgi:hypothetical protein